MDVISDQNVREVFGAEQEETGLGIQFWGKLWNCNI
jgi:hypothetical protein